MSDQLPKIVIDDPCGCHGEGNSIEDLEIRLCIFHEWATPRIMEALLGSTYQQYKGPIKGPAFLDIGDQ